MATVRDLINDAMFSIGALGQGEALSDADAQLCLRRFRRLVSAWANENLMAYVTTDGTMTLANGTATYSSALLSSGRPVSIQNVYLRWNNVDYVINASSEPDFDAISYKLAKGLPSTYLYKAGYPDGSFSFYPTPGYAYVVHVVGRYPAITAGATLDTVVTLPDGYEAALCDNLALDVASSFGLQAPPQLVDSARQAKRWIKTTNHVPLQMESTLVVGRRQPGYIRIIGDT